MNIFEARKLQKVLYKQSEVDYKRMRTRVCNGKLYYSIVHHISDNSFLVLSKDLLKRFTDSTCYDVETQIFFVHESDFHNGPVGMYIGEIIVIDD